MEFEFTRAFIADPADPNYPEAPTTALINLNELEEDCEDGFGLVPGTVVIGDPETFEDTAIASYAAPGDLQAAHRHRRATLQMGVMFKPPADGSRRVGPEARALAGALEAGGVFAYQLRGEEDLLYFDFVSSPSVTLLRAQPNELTKIGKRGTDPDGMPVRLLCHPHPRLAPVELGPFTIDNTHDGRDFLMTNPGDLPGEVEIILEPTAGSLIAVRYGIRDHGPLTEFRSFFSRDATTFDPNQPDTTLQSVDGEDALVMAFSEEQMVRRFRDERVVTDATAAAGVYWVWARLRVVDGTAETTKFKVQGRYGFSTADVAMETMRKVTLDARDLNAPQFVEVRVGKLIVPVGVKRVVFDFAAQRATGDQELAVTDVIFEPADYQHGVVAPPGFRLGAWGRVVWDPEELEGTGSRIRDAFRLNQQGEYARTSPTTGLRLPVGVHEVTFHAVLREPQRDEAVMAIGEITRLPGAGGADVVHKSVKLRTKEDHLWTEIERTVTFQVTQAEVDAGDKFRFELRQDRATANKRRTHVFAIEHRYLEAFSSGQPLVLDPHQRRAYARDAANIGVPLFPAVHENDPLLAPAGDSVWVMALGDRATDPGYREFDEREPVARSVRTRTANVTLKVTPRRWGIA